jgi:hypothetical protein
VVLARRTDCSARSALEHAHLRTPAGTDDNQRTPVTDACVRISCSLRVPPSSVNCTFSLC